MEIPDILTQQQTWLDTLRTNLASPSPAGVSATLNAGAAQVAAIQARIAALQQQKDETVRRFHAAIARQQNALEALRAGPVSTAARVQQPSTIFGTVAARPEE